MDDRMDGHLTVKQHQQKLNGRKEIFVSVVASRFNFLFLPSNYLGKLLFL